MAWWTTLPRSWRLEDVQAVLNVVINGLSGLSILVFTRWCWQLGAAEVLKRKTVPLASLLTLGTPGEALDAIVFLKSHIFHYWKLVAQCSVVIALSVTAILSGPIAKYSTRLTHVTVYSEIDGLLAGRFDNTMEASQVTWNLTQESLDNAGFPTDQLLDYMPNSNNLWIYRPEEWNNSWTMQCKPTESTAIDMVFTSDCTTLESKLGSGLLAAFPSLRYFSNFSYWSTSDYNTNGTYIKDLLIFLYAANYSDWDESSSTHRRVDMQLTALYSHGAPKNATDNDAPCRFGVGPINATYYTRVDCALLRTVDNLENPDQGAFPDIGTVVNVPSAFLWNYLPRFKQESMEDREITIISPHDLQRFYQTYMIAKDTQMIRPVPRKMSVKVIAVQLSAIFLAAFGFLGLFIVLGGTQYVVFSLLRHRNAIESIPRSKLDWIYQTIRPGRLSRNTTEDPVIKASASGEAKAERKRALFEAAEYRLMVGSHSSHVEALSPLSSNRVSGLSIVEGPETEASDLIRKGGYGSHG